MAELVVPNVGKPKYEADAASELVASGLSGAAQRLGKRIEELRWVLKFVQRERHEVADEISKVDSALVYEALWFSRDAELIGLQDRGWILAAFDSLKSAIAAFVEPGAAVLEVEKVSFVLLNRRAADWERGPEVELFYRSKDPATRLVLAACRLLELEGKRLARCAKCGRLYVRQKRALFCSKRCSQREQARRWRERHPGLQQQRQREYYKRKLRKKIAGVNGRKKVAVIVKQRARIRKGSE